MRKKGIEKERRIRGILKEIKKILFLFGIALAGGSIAWALMALFIWSMSLYP